MKKAIVTGANGFIGTALCKALSARGVKIYAVIKDEKENIDSISSISDIEIIYCDLSAISRLPEIIADRDIDVMYHLAWVGSAGPLRGDYSVQIDNIRSSCDAVKSCAEIGCHKFVFASSIMEYEVEAVMQSEAAPSKNTLYCSAKIAADYMARTVAASLNIDYVRALISNIYGEGEVSPRLINTSLRKLMRNEHCSFSPGEQMYDFIYITDAAEVFCELGEKGKANKTYYIGSTPRPLKSFLLEMRDIAAPGAELGLGDLEFNGVSLTYEEFDIHAVEEDTGYKPLVTFSEGIRKTIEWIRKADRNGKV